MGRIPTIIIVLLFFVFSTMAFAHPPEAIVYKYYPETKILSVGVSHPVKESKKHFIKLIEIKLNGKDWITQNFLSQTNKDVQAVSYAVVDLKKGDVIDISAVCSVSGELKKTIKIE